MRESISYGMDFINGDRTEVKKIKSDSTVKGIATIELFDSRSGEKVYEAKTENLINVNVGKKAYMEFFYHRLKGEIDKFYIKSPFRYLILTDYEEKEVEDLNYYRGKLIGYADKQYTYSGSDLLKGTVNQKETELDVNGDGLLHFVFDFPTHAANGVFNTVWWSGDMSSNLNTKEVKKLEFEINRTESIAESGIHRLKDKWVCIFGSGSGSGITTRKILYAVVLNDDFSLYKYIDLKTILGSLATTYFYWGTSDNGIVLNKTDTTNESVIMIDIETEKVTKLSVKVGYSTVNIRKGKLYMTGYEFVEYSINGNEVSELKNYGKSQYHVFSEYDGKPAFYGKDDNNLYYLRNGEAIKTPLKKGSDIRIDFDGKDFNYAYRITGAKHEEGKIKIDLTKYYFYPDIGAQTLLPEPITKTPIHTMKIQYDFKVEKV